MTFDPGLAAKPVTILAFVLLAAAIITRGAHAQEVDLTPEKQKVEIEGGIFNELLAMRDGTTRIFYQPPAEWSVLPVSSTKLVLRPQGSSMAEAVILARPGIKSRTTEEMVAEFRRLLPADAMVLDEVGEPQKHTSINGAPVFTLTSRYKLADVEMQRSAVFMHYHHASFVILLTSHPADHEPLFKQLLGSLFTWYWEDDKNIQPATIIEKPDEESDSEGGKVAG